MIDEHSGTWLAVKAHCAEKLAGARSAIEMRGADPATTEFLRGQIGALKGVLSLAEKKMGGNGPR